MVKQVQFLIEELQLFVNYLLSAFSKKYKNYWLCVLLGLPLVYLYDHPSLILNIFN